MADILIKNMEMPSCCDKCFFVKKCSAHAVQLKKIAESEHEQIFDVFGEMRLSDCPLVELTSHGDLADKRTIIERMGDAHDELFDKVDSKALSECHIAFLKAVIYAPTVIPSTDSAVVLERTTR